MKGEKKIKTNLDVLPIAQAKPKLDVKVSVHSYSQNQKICHKSIFITQ